MKRLAYATYEYYAGTFGGNVIPEEEFAALARMASDVIDAAVTIPIDLERDDAEAIAKACAYEAEYLYAQGGQDAITGKAENQVVVNEHLDDYSVTKQQTSEAKNSALSVNGIPFSPLAYDILRKQGLTARWLYAKQYRERMAAYGL